MIHTTAWRSVATVALVGAIIGACSVPTPSPLGHDPVGLRGSGNTQEFADSFTPGTPFGWALIIENDADQPATVDGYELIDKSSALEVVGAAVIPTGFGGGAGQVTGPLSVVNDDLRSAVAARPLIGSEIGPTNTAGWADGGNLVFLFQVARVGDYSLAGVRLRYHVGSQAFETLIPASLEVCAGATEGTAACPFKDSNPGP
jgi:hypothetical protein